MRQTASISIPQQNNDTREVTSTTEYASDDGRCDFPEINSSTSINHACSGILESKTENIDWAVTLNRNNLPANRRHSDMYVFAQSHARRRNSSPKNGDTAAAGHYNSKLPDNTPCRPDLITCCQNVATFLADAASSSRSSDRKRLPTAKYIYSYMRCLFAILQLEPECCVYADIYVRRLLSNAKGLVDVNTQNWHIVLVGACLLASKYVDDVGMNNGDFSIALADCSLKLINRLESKYVELLNWKLHVPISEYTTRYFELAKKQDRACDWDIDFKRIQPRFTVVLSNCS